MTTLVLGSNGYIGRNLVLACWECSDLILSSRSPCLPTAPFAFVQADLIHSAAALSEVAFDRLIILARPDSNDPAEVEPFYASLRSLVRQRVGTRELKEVHYVSTCLVYPDSTEPLTSKTPARPANYYAYAKLCFEYWLGLLSDEFEELEVAIYRVPLLYGGAVTDRQRTKQYIYRWVDEYREGTGWAFCKSADTRSGFSWLHTADFCTLLAAGTSCRFRLANASSGFVTFTEFHKTMVSRVHAARQTAEAPAWRQEITDEVGLPKRHLADWLS